MNWLKDPKTHFRPQLDGDLVKDSVCGIYIAEKLGLRQPTASEHLRVFHGLFMDCYNLPQPPSPANAIRPTTWRRFNDRGRRTR